MLFIQIQVARGRTRPLGVDRNEIIPADKVADSVAAHSKGRQRCRPVVESSRCQRRPIGLRPFANRGGANEVTSDPAVTSSMPRSPADWPAFRRRPISGRGGCCAVRQRGATVRPSFFQSRENGGTANGTLWRVVAAHPGQNGEHVEQKNDQVLQPQHQPTRCRVVTEFHRMARRP